MIVSNKPLPFPKESGKGPDTKYSSGNDTFIQNKRPFKLLQEVQRCPFKISIAPGLS